MEPRITFGMIVLNGEPFVRYNLRSLYPFAHQIIVVEGACPGAVNISTPTGHSRDTTLDSLRRFKADEDPDNKLVIVTAEDEGHPDGFWVGEKDEMSQAYAKRATGNYLWQVDSDEFYKAEDMQSIIDMLTKDPTVSGATFKQISFWGGIDYWVDSTYLRNGAAYYHRLFRWEPGFEYATHRPPTVIDHETNDLRTMNWLTGKTLEAKNICLYHYSLLFPKQVQEKCDYYSNAEWTNKMRAVEWAENCYNRISKPFRVHNVLEYPSWLCKFKGKHPAQLVCMMDDIRNGTVDVELRCNSDLERLLKNPLYSIARSFLHHTAWAYPYWQKLINAIRHPEKIINKIYRTARR